MLPYATYFNPITCLGYCKLTIGFLKYTPPVYWNYKRKSTKGWSIFNIILDLTGGIFSFASGSIDTSNGLNITKVILAVMTIFYDLVFVIQHYCIYRGSSDREEFYRGDDTKDEETEQNYKLIE